MKIETYQTKGSLTTEAPAVQMSADALGQSGRNLETLGKTVSETALKVKKVYDDTTSLAAQRDMAIGVNALKTRMATDQNLNANQAQYQKEFSQVRDNALKQVGDAEYRNQLSTKFDIEQANFDYDFSVANNKQIVDSKLATMEALNNESAIQFVSANMARRQVLLQEVRDRYVGAASDGSMKKEDAISKIYEKSRAMNKSVVLQDIQNDAEATFQNLKSGFYNYDPETGLGVDPRDKADLMEKARTQHKNNMEAKTFIQESNQEANELDISKKITTPGEIMKIDTEKMSQDVIYGDMSERMYNAVVKGLSNPKAINGTAASDPKTLQELAALHDNPKYSRKSLRADLAEAWADGRLSKQDYGRLMDSPVNMKSVGVDNTGEKESKYSEAFKKMTLWVKDHAVNASESFPRLFRTLSDQIKAKGVDMAMQIAEAAIRDEAVRQDPRLAGHKDLPNNIMDAEGGFKSVYSAQESSAKAADMKVGDTIIIEKNGVKRKIPAANKAKAEELKWKVVDSGTEQPTKPAAK